MSLANSRTSATASAVSVAVGLALIVSGDPTVAGAGVLLIMLGAIAALLALGLYFDDSERQVAGS